jgi:hypothetical protein
MIINVLIYTGTFTTWSLETDFFPLYNVGVTIEVHTSILIQLDCAAMLNSNGI